MTEIARHTDNPTQPYLKAFKEFAQTAASQNPPWIQQLRKSAIKRFSEQRDWFPLDKAR
jgi:hypothetical protein